MKELKGAQTKQCQSSCFHISTLLSNSPEPLVEVQHLTQKHSKHGYLVSMPRLETALHD